MLRKKDALAGHVDGMPTMTTTHPSQSLLSPNPFNAISDNEKGEITAEHELMQRTTENNGG